MKPKDVETLVQAQGPFVFDRMFGAMEKVRERLDRACKALDAGGVPYAVIGGNAVAAWVATKDDGAVRNTQDIDILLESTDIDAATKALEAAGFVRIKTTGVTMFIDGPDGKPSQAVHVIWAGEKVKPSYPVPAPQIDQVQTIDGKRVVDLNCLLKMKLTSNRRKDQVHVLDMIGVGLIDESWLGQLELELAERLQALLDDPDG